LEGSDVAVKARLLDQRRVAGLGNLLTDEVLWRAGIAPRRASSSLDGEDVRRLAKEVRATIRLLTARGGSHTGDLQEQRHRDGRCPRDGSELRRETVGGRTTYWCPAHQR
jgi:formamidopyrimidine-DNA glycosylase